MALPCEKRYLSNAKYWFVERNECSGSLWLVKKKTIIINEVCCTPCVWFSPVRYIYYHIVLNATKIWYRKPANPVRNVEYTNVVGVVVVVVVGFSFEGDAIRLQRVVFRRTQSALIVVKILYICYFFHSMDRYTP